MLLFLLYVFVGSSFNTQRCTVDIELLVVNTSGKLPAPDLKQTNRPLFTAFAPKVSNNDAGFAVVTFFSGRQWLEVGRK